MAPRRNNSRPPDSRRRSVFQGARLELGVHRFEQPDDVTCGPTCLRKIFHYYDDDIPFDEILAKTRRNPDGGTLAVYLGLSALQYGYRATLYPNHLRIFDPTWFELPRKALQGKLLARAAILEAEPRLRTVTEAYAEFLEEGGRIEFPELEPELITSILDREHPVLAGLSATFLYRQIRERPDDNEDDDLRGEPVGHFVVICGYSGSGRHFMIRDPSKHVPFSKSGRYLVPAQRLISSILLGDSSYDAVLLEIWPRNHRGV